MTTNEYANSVNGSQNLYGRVTWWMTEHDTLLKEHSDNKEVLLGLIKEAMDILYTIYESGVYEREEQDE